jgi:hypothetical protein
MSPEPGLVDRATEVRADAVKHLTALAGDASMCAIGRSGRSFPAAKYHEGRLSAASQLRRTLSRLDHSAGAGECEEAVAGVQQEWEQTLESAEKKGPDWVAYATGGLDAIIEVTDPGR